jgi:uncharacterized membrane protein YhaH (DUF805 family)
MNWYLMPFKRYADFSGRSQRAEYWYFTLGNFIVGFILGLIDGMMGAASQGGVGLLTMIYFLGILIPSLAVSVRRLHDIGRTGWWIFVAIIPILGPLLLLYFYVLDSEPGANAYGPNPKLSAAVA